MQDMDTLMSKSLSELREIARALGLDIRSGREKLVAKILDATRTEEPLNEESQMPQRRTRKRIATPQVAFTTRMGESPEEEVTAPSEEPATTEEPVVEPAPKRRGRPRKNPLPEEVAPALPAEEPAPAVSEVAPTEPAPEEAPKTA